MKGKNENLLRNILFFLINYWLMYCVVYLLDLVVNFCFILVFDGINSFVYGMCMFFCLIYLFIIGEIM